MTGQTLTHEQSTLLLGALAVDAVEPDEFVALEEHLARCASCRHEVRRHHETLTDMVLAAAPPLDLRSRVLAARPARLPLEVTFPQLVVPADRGRSFDRPVVDDLIRRGERRPRRIGNAIGARRLVVAVAACGALVVAVGAGVVRGREQPPALDQLAASARSDTHSRTVTLRATGGGAGAGATAVVAEDGTGYLFSADLPGLPVGRTYQLWALGGPDGKTPVSLGVLGRDPDVSLFRADTRVNGFALSEERDGGAVTPNPPLAVGTF